MGWLIGIAAVMIAAHLYFKYGARRLERERERKAAERHPPDGGPHDA